MNLHCLYIIGEPASGKSTLTAALTKGAASSIAMKPFGHMYWEAPGGTVVELGVRRSEFSGTDALSMSVQPKVLAQLDVEPPKLLMAEGDRLANMKFFSALKAMGYNLTVVNLTPPEVVLDTWRQRRNERLGKAQDDTWLRGRQSKVRNLAETCGAIPITAVTTDERMDALRALDNPVVNAFGRVEALR
jgi:adenylate kinase family enzyme